MTILFMVLTAALGFFGEAAISFGAPGLGQSAFRLAFVFAVIAILVHVSKKHKELMAKISSLKS